MIPKVDKVYIKPLFKYWPKVSGNACALNDSFRWLFIIRFADGEKFVQNHGKYKNIKAYYSDFLFHYNRELARGQEERYLNYFYSSALGLHRSCKEYDPLYYKFLYEIDK